MYQNNESKFCEFIKIGSSPVSTSYVLNNPTCVYDHCYSMCDDNMDIITVLKDMIDVRDGFKTCAYYTHNDVEDVINGICLPTHTYTPTHMHIHIDKLHD